MKESISNIWLLGIVIIFILIFAAYIAITVDYSRTFRLKNEVLTIIEKNKGFTDAVGKSGSSKIKTGETIQVGVGAAQTINLYLSGNGYLAKGHCPNDGNIWLGVKELGSDSLSIESAVSNEKYYYCISKYNTGKVAAGTYRSIYYKVRLFYKMEFPVLQDFFSVKVEGITDEIYKPVNDIFNDSMINGDYYS